MRAEVRVVLGMIMVLSTALVFSSCCPRRVCSPGPCAMGKAKAPAVEGRIGAPAAKAAVAEGAISTREALRPVYFCYNEPFIPPYDEDQLDVLTRFLKENPATRIRISGHCDERGTEEYNLELGEKRALMVKDYLQGRGIAPDRMETVSYGESRPVNPLCDNEPCYQKNRRAEFEIIQQ